jgi:putative hydrolase of the HAD superfamily
MTPQSFSEKARVTPRAIVFDLDDTLYLERDFADSGFIAVGQYCCAELGLSDFARRAAESFSAGKREKIFDSVLASYGIVPEPSIVAELVALYREHIPSIRLLSDAQECLHKLHGQLPLALLTDGPSRTQWNKIRALGIEAIFQTIVVTGDLGPEYAKPHPLAFQIVEERLGTHGAHLVYVADNPTKDFQAPRQLGWQTLRIRRTGGIYTDRLTGEAVDHEVSDLWDFPA